MRYALFLLPLFILFSCSTTRKPYYAEPFENQEFEKSKEQVHSLYLLGDTGDKNDSKKNYVLRELQKMLELESEASSLVFLGNQIYHHGMPGIRSENRTDAENVLCEQLEIINNYKGSTYFIPGQKDWNNGKKGGLKVLKRQQNYIETYYNEKNKAQMFPGSGCGDPKVIKIHKDLVFIFLDTQWWLQNWSNELGMNQGCDIKSRYDLIKSIEEILTEHKNDEVVFFMHHPIISNGVHNGHFSLSDHIFPFKETHNISMPLPLIGSIVVLARNIVGTKQDLNNDHYRELMKGIEEVAHKIGVHTLFASAHDNSLQHFDEDKLQYLISGSGSKTNRAVKANGASFIQQERGFCKITFHKDFEMWLEIFSITGPDKEATLVYKRQIRAPRPGTVDEKIEYPPISSPDTIIAASSEFLAGRVKEVFLGEQYREMWGTPVKAPIIDLEKKFGGLTPIKKGGGMASNSLRMQTKNGKQYILRSIKKDYRKLVPPDFANLKLLNLLKDQNSASHPYGALILPSLSKAAGIYYTHPKLVYLKHHRGMGNYNSQFPEELYLLEERPNDDWRDANQFGNSSDIIGYTDLLKIIREKKNHFIDQEWVLKSRMFDLLIHDWDRHDDQWRWASFKEGGKTIYRPIPRDRDQAFYKFKGIIPWYIAATAVKKFKTMKEDVKDVKNLSFNARHFDRYFMHDLEWNEWQIIIRELQNSITDEVIEKSMLGFPEEVQAMNEKELIGLLKARRDNLESIGKKLYDYLSEEVEISGTDNDERFEVTSLENGNVQVKMYITRAKKEDLLKYDRTFYPEETREIRMYGLRGKDTFVITGSKNSKISIRVIGGEEADLLRNSTAARKIAVYDEIGGIEIEGSGIRDFTSNRIEVNEYKRAGFRYNTSTFFPTMGWTKDDGFWFGGFTSQTIHGWRKNPFKSKHTFSFSLAPFSQDAFKINYKGSFPNVLGAIDFSPSVHLDFPSYENYFGLGNESVNPKREKEFNWVKMRSIEIAPLFTINSENNSISLSFGPAFESHKVKNTEGRVSSDEVLGFTNDEFERHNFLGGSLGFQFGFVDNKVFPSYGFQIDASLDYLNALSGNEDLVDLSTAVHTYFPLSRKPQLVLANKVGYQKSWGTRQFYQYPDLGNLTNLRGFRNNRFHGETAFFHNIDLRLMLFEWENDILPMDVGILGGYDYGRVWMGNEESDKWHKSQTIGLWFNILGAAVVQPYYSFTEEGDLFTFKIGFNF